MTQSEADNARAALIVHGSYAPGGENHSRLAFFPGAWRKGFVLGARQTSGDDIAPGQEPVEAWLLDFPRPQADRQSAQYQAWARRLSDLWAGLDAVMGKSMARDIRPWWPEGHQVIEGVAGFSESETANDETASGERTCDGSPGRVDGMTLATIYLPLHRVAERADIFQQDAADVGQAQTDGGAEEVLARAKEDDLETQWRQTFTGAAEHDHSQFIGLIKDADPDRLDSLFGDLPDGGRFLERLKRLLADHMPRERRTLSAEVQPLARNSRPLEVLVELARRDIAQRAGFLHARGKASHAEALENLTFVTGKPDNPEWERAADALDAFADEIRSSGPRRPAWHYCLKDACHGIASDYVLQDWLMLFLLQPDLPQPRPRPRGGLISRLGLRRGSPSLDLEPAYSLWKAGGRYEIDGDRCCVYEVERRDGSSAP
ncbi:hypothetical protein ACQKKX_01195 [Neorhizobium sp. NPDC001467]|uniref:hypothetical protein n=1 Tax=Neorhizobium sp. NPDC001467 TaxID=3390595 RepID=UPI003D08F972